MTDDETLFRAPRLTRLEIQGFKSFLNRTVFAFEPGITGIVGPNGSGKSTLLGALLGRLPLKSGSRIVGSSIVVGELAQRRAAFRQDESLLSLFTSRVTTSTEDARTLLAKFGVGADDVGRAAASLSPGERTRAHLAELQARGVNLLVLDEPTNHLDLEAVEQLEQALPGFTGTVVVVSHDRRFLERLAPTRRLELGPYAASRT